MHAGISRFVCGLLLSILAVSAAAAEDRADTDATSGAVDRGRRTAIEALIDRALKECQVPGVVVGLWTPGSHWVAAHGLADVDDERPIRRRDRLGIRSITKSFTVTLVLQLAAEERLKLDHPVARYIEGVPNGRKITLRHLANMTSGLFDYTRDPRFGEELTADPLRPWTATELLAFSFRHPVNFQPGTAYEYSNTNTILLGEVIERVTGRRFEEVLNGRILRPLDLGSTFYFSGSRIPLPAARGYQGVDDAGEPDEVIVSFTGLGPAGAMVSRLDDLRRWGAVLVEGDLLPARLQRQRFQARRATNGPDYDRYGLGMGEIAGWWGHTGEGIGYEAAVFHHPGRNETFAILLNASNFPDVPARVFRRLVPILNAADPAMVAWGSRPLCGDD